MVIKCIVHMHVTADLKPTGFLVYDNIHRCCDAHYISNDFLNQARKCAL